MSYENEIRATLKKDRPAHGMNTRAINLGRRADKEISNLKIEIEADDRNVNNLMDQLNSLVNKIEALVEYQEGGALWGVAAEIVDKLKTLINEETED